MSTTSTAPARNTSYLARPGGRIGYDVADDGPLVVQAAAQARRPDVTAFLATALRRA